MVDVLYMEKAVRDHPRARAISERLPRATRVACESYGEVFNRRSQSFRLQKRRPALILAEKRGSFTLETPAGYGIGPPRSLYFSHMLNCAYDCRYCFLQGMFLSAHYVLFVNYEDFQEAIAQAVAEGGAEETCFFSGYDCDSLALEELTGFAREFLPFFAGLDGAWLELRTKSTQVGELLEREPLSKCVVAFSMMPDVAGRRFENTPSLARRLEAMRELGSRGWKLGLRFDPVIWFDGFRDAYRAFFEDVFSIVPLGSLHSVSLGAFRLPRSFFKRMARLFPDEALLAGPLEERDGMVSYAGDLESEALGFCREEILRRVPSEIFFPCGS